MNTNVKYTACLPYNESCMVLPALAGERNDSVTHEKKQQGRGGARETANNTQQQQPHRHQQQYRFDKANKQTTPTTLSEEKWRRFFVHA